MQTKNQKPKNPTSFEEHVDMEARENFVIFINTYSFRRFCIAFAPEKTRKNVEDPSSIRDFLRMDFGCF